MAVGSRRLSSEPVQDLSAELELSRKKIAVLQRQLDDTRGAHLREVARLRNEVVLANRDPTRSRRELDAVNYFCNADQPPVAESDSDLQLKTQEISILNGKLDELRTASETFCNASVRYKAIATARTMMFQRSSLLLQRVLKQAGYCSILEYMQDEIDKGRDIDFDLEVSADRANESVERGAEELFSKSQGGSADGKIAATHLMHKATAGAKIADVDVMLGAVMKGESECLLDVPPIVEPEDKDGIMQAEAGSKEFDVPPLVEPEDKDGIVQAEESSKENENERKHRPRIDTILSSCMSEQSENGIDLFPTLFLSEGNEARDGNEVDASVSMLCAAAFIPPASGDEAEHGLKAGISKTRRPVPLSADGVSDEQAQDDRNFGLDLDMATPRGGIFRRSVTEALVVASKSKVLSNGMLEASALMARALRKLPQPLSPRALRVPGEELRNPPPTPFASNCSSNKRGASAQPDVHVLEDSIPFFFQPYSTLPCHATVDPPVMVDHATSPVRELLPSLPADGTSVGWMSCSNGLGMATRSPTLSSQLSGPYTSAEQDDDSGSDAAVEQVLSASDNRRCPTSTPGPYRPSPSAKLPELSLPRSPVPPRAPPADGEVRSGSRQFTAMLPGGAHIVHVRREGRFLTSKCSDRGTSKLMTAPPGDDRASSRPTRSSRSPDLEGDRVSLGPRLSMAKPVIGPGESLPLPQMCNSALRGRRPSFQAADRRSFSHGQPPPRT